MGTPADRDWRDLDTTPEFREFVGRKLDQLLEGTIREKDRCKHLRAAPVEGGVCLLAGAPPLQVSEEPAAQPPAKRPRLAGVDLQRYQLKKKHSRERASTVNGAGRQAAPADTDAAAACRRSEREAGAAPAPAPAPEDGDSDDSSDDEQLACFAEAAVPEHFMASLATSKTVKLDAS